MARVVCSRSDSFSRSRSACSMTVSPSAAAATAASTGTRSGIPEASIRCPRRGACRAVISPSPAVISAPKPRSSSRIARSPCRDSGFMPSTVTPAGLRAPRASRNAAEDQSDSTVISRAAPDPSFSAISGSSFFASRPKGPCPPGIRYSFPSFSSFSARRPNCWRASSVIRMYPADSVFPVTRSRLSPGSRGRANSSPEIYWEEMLPGISYSPGRSLPEKISRSPSFRRRIPCFSSRSPRGCSGRSGSRPSIRNSPRSPSAPHTGSRNRSVDPLSPQGSTASPSAVRIGRTLMPSSPRVISLPMARRQAMVASMSREIPRHFSTVSRPPAAAQISSRCARDLDAGTAARPVRGPGATVCLMPRLPA